ncbi:MULTISPECIES: rhodanese-like domain-containing protein [Idiomarinaceae]|uniref:Rhodanese-related sulfurtransferase n=4 Tax=Pseudidiomarina TaxID=2800384 RepID=A0A368UKT1_9GAMM|nr:MULTISPECIES: rhodanese-like domain-containing protein [Idiomarinaceae]MDX1526323.1 rhodanese-like domain-containing protein [Pseudidiomarina maritima]MRJ42860.1 rhodanese-like domain-containing protein [Idiomarina sp. FeN1]NCU58410.1 rhodanese-like domain-containing protein [Idiomarina sp. FenA--70]NCU61108.1 rhodanese-like domain-containing protein [Idiomarina sp. FenBw--71]PWW09344.1 rhodanese-related sulfurtransferase [Pseudidiomarina maritima]
MEQILAFAADHLFMSLLWVILLIAIVVTYVQAATSKIKSLTPQQATLLINRNDGVYVDIRSVDEYRKGHIQDSLHLTADKIRKNELAPLEKFKSAPIVVVCATGMTAKGAAATLAKAGFEQVAILQGGISAWQGASFPLVKK